MPQWSRPEPVGPGKYPTLNRMGFSFDHTLEQPHVQRFLASIKPGAGPVLDIGAAYGILTHAILARGATCIANDLDVRHLQILEATTPIDMRDRLQTIPGAFPDAIALPPDSLSAISCLRVLHFLEGEAIMHGVACMHKWLRPGGRVLVLAITPYVAAYRAHIPDYERRKTAGDVWPGVVTNARALPLRDPDHLPELLHCLDVDVLRRVFENAGFAIECCEYFSPPNYDPLFHLDGRESVALLATKSSK